jgi:hypothetical protein
MIGRERGKKKEKDGCIFLIVHYCDNRRDGVFYSLVLFPYIQGCRRVPTTTHNQRKSHSRKSTTWVTIERGWRCSALIGVTSLVDPYARPPFFLFWGVDGWGVEVREEVELEATWLRRFNAGVAVNDREELKWLDIMKMEVIVKCIYNNIINKKNDRKWWFFIDRLKIFSLHQSKHNGH